MLVRVGAAEGADGRGFAGELCCMGGVAGFRRLCSLEVFCFVLLLVGPAERAERRGGVVCVFGVLRCRCVLSRAGVACWLWRAGCEGVCEFF